MGLAEVAAVSPRSHEVYPLGFGGRGQRLAQRLDLSVHLPEISSMFFLHSLIPQFYCKPDPLVGSLNESERSGAIRL